MKDVKNPQPSTNLTTNFGVKISKYEQITIFTRFFDITDI